MKKLLISLSALFIVIILINIIFVNNTFFYNLRGYLPQNIKEFLKNTVFFIPEYKRNKANTC